MASLLKSKKFVSSAENRVLKYVNKLFYLTYFFSFAFWFQQILRINCSALQELKLTK